MPVILRLARADKQIIVTADGVYAFVRELNEGAPYVVEVQTRQCVRCKEGFYATSLSYRAARRCGNTAPR